MNDSLQSKAANFSSEVAKVRGPDWLKWLGHLAGKPGVRGLELGTWKGESAEWWLENILTGDGSFLCCVDTFNGSDEHRLAGIDCSGILDETIKRLSRFGPPASQKTNFEGRWTFFRSPTRRELPRQIAKYACEECGGYYDFAYIDAGHDAQNVLRDSVLAWELIKVGGTVIWDDYLWTVMPDELDRPKLAIDSFLACYARSMEIVSFGGWQVCVKKTSAT